METKGFWDAAWHGPHKSREMVYKSHQSIKNGQTDIFDNEQNSIQPGSCTDWFRLVSFSKVKTAWIEIFGPKWSSTRPKILLKQTWQVYKKIHFIKGN